MSRALFESTLDPFVFIYNFLTQNTDNQLKGKWIYFSLVLFSLTVIAFFSLVYNDFIIFYCCGLEHNTYSEINHRLSLDRKRKTETRDTILIGDNFRLTMDRNTFRYDNLEMKILESYSEENI